MVRGQCASPIRFEERRAQSEDRTEYPVAAYHGLYPPCQPPILHRRSPCYRCSRGKRAWVRGGQHGPQRAATRRSVHSPGGERQQEWNPGSRRRVGPLRLPSSGPAGNMQGRKGRVLDPHCHYDLASCVVPPPPRASSAAGRRRPAGSATGPRARSARSQVRYGASESKKAGPTDEAPSAPASPGFAAPRPRNLPISSALLGAGAQTPANAAADGVRQRDPVPSFFRQPMPRATPRAGEVYIRFTLR